MEPGARKPSLATSLPPIKKTIHPTLIVSPITLYPGETLLRPAHPRRAEERLSIRRRDQVLGAALSGPPQRPLVEGYRDRAVQQLCLFGEGVYYILQSRLAPAATQAADAFGPHGKIHGRVDT